MPDEVATVGSRFWFGRRSVDSEESRIQTLRPELPAKVSATRLWQRHFADHASKHHLFIALAVLMSPVKT